MNGHPEPPPEGALIEAARREAGLSVREAARRAGISEGWWRQVVKGYQSMAGGGHGPVHAPADTVAKMAAVVGVTPEQMKGEGQRPDAAEAIRHERATPAPQKTGIRVIDEGATEQELAPFVWQIEREVEEAERKFGPDPAGEQVFGPGHEADAWNSPTVSRDATIRLLATLRLFAFQNRGGQSGTRTGLNRFRVLSRSP